MHCGACCCYCAGTRACAQAVWVTPLVTSLICQTSLSASLTCNKVRTVQGAALFATRCAQHQGTALFAQVCMPLVTC